MANRFLGTKKATTGVKTNKFLTKQPEVKTEQKTPSLPYRPTGEQFSKLFTDREVVSVPGADYLPEAVRKRREEGLAKFGVTEDTGGGMSIPKTLGGPSFGYEFQSKDVHGESYKSPRVQFDTKTRQQIAGENEIYDKYGNVAGEINHLVPVELGGTNKNYNLDWRKNIRTEKEAKAKKDVSFTAGQQEGRVLEEQKQIAAWKRGEITQGQAVVNLLAWDELRNKEKEKPSNILTGKEALKQSIKDSAKQLGNDLLRPLDFIHRTGLQTTLSVTPFTNMAVASAAKALGDKDLKNVSYDELWKQSLDTTADAMIAVGAPTEAFKKTPKQITLFENQYKEQVKKMQEADKKGDVSGFLKGFGTMAFYKFAEDWANPFYLFSIKGVSKGSFKMAPKEKVLMDVELNPAKHRFLQSGEKLKGKETTKVYQIDVKQNVVAEQAKPGAKLKVTEKPDVKMYITKKPNGNVQVKVTNSGGEIFDKQSIQTISQNPELLQAQQTKIIDNLQLKPEMVKRALSDAAGKVNNGLVGDMNKMTPLGQKILDLEKNLTHVDSPGKLYTEIAKVVRADKSLTPEVTKQLLGVPTAEKALARTGIGGTIQDFFIVMKDPELAAMPQLSPYIKSVEDSAKIFSGKLMPTPKPSIAPSTAKSIVQGISRIELAKIPAEKAGRNLMEWENADLSTKELQKKLDIAIEGKEDKGLINQIRQDISDRTAAQASKTAEIKTQPLEVAKQPTIREKIGQKQELHATQPKAQQSNIKKDAGKKEAQAKEPGFEITPETRLQYLERQLADKLNRVKEVQKQIEKQKGAIISEQADAYLQAELYIGRAADKVKRVENNFVVPFVKKMTGQKADIEEFDKFLMAKHAQERNAQIARVNPDMADGGSGLTNEQAQQILNQFRNAGTYEKYERLADEYYKNITTERLKVLVDSGLIKKDLADKLQATYKNYVPLKGKAGEQTIGPRGQGFSVSGKDIKRAKGRKSLAESPFARGILDYQDTLIRAEKNKVAQSFLKLVEENPNDKVWSVESLKYKPIFDKNGELQYLDPKYKFADNVMEVRVDGKIKLITIHDAALAQAMKNMGVEKGIKVLHKVNNYLRAINTTMNPEFVITNFERDLQTAAINLGGEQSAKMAKDVVKDIPRAMKGIYRNIRKGDTSSEWAKVYDDLKKEGGKIGYFDRDTVEEKLLDIRKIVSRYNSDKAADKFSQVLKSTGDYIENVNEVVEMAVRTSAYKHAIDNGLSRAKAASLAKNLTVNFNKKGNLGVALNTLYLFANAGIQGTMRVFKALKYPGVRRIVYAVIASAFGISELNKKINKEEYDKLGDDFNNRNLAIMMPNGNHVKIKLPYGYNIFKIMGDIASDTLHGDQDLAGAGKRLLLALDESWNPLSSATLPQLISPTLTDPFIQQAENKNWFGGPIKPEQLPFTPKQKESSLFFSTVRPQSKAITDWLNSISGGDEVKAGFLDFSPELIDHYLDTYVGGSGRFVSNIISTGVDLVKGDMPELENMPFARQVYGTSPAYADRGLVTEYLDEAGRKEFSNEEINKFKKALANIREKGEWDDDKIKDAISEFNRGQNKLKASQALDKVKKEKMTPEQAKQYLDSLPDDVYKQVEKILEDRAKTQEKLSK